VYRSEGVSIDVLCDGMLGVDASGQHARNKTWPPDAIDGLYYVYSPITTLAERAPLAAPLRLAFSASPPSCFGRAD
jgi:hypothetical protein